MTKGTPSMGKKSGKKTHIRCRRCGKHTYHAQHSECAACGFGKTKKIRRFSWQNKRAFGAFRKINLKRMATKVTSGRGNRNTKK